MAIVPMPIVPSSTTRVTIVRMIRPSTSSATAAPRTTRASFVDNARRSPKTRAVMPTLVAVSVAPMNNDVLPFSPRARPVADPRMSGRPTPMIATVIADRPTLRNSPTSISIPTCIKRRIAPSSARRKSESDGSTRPRTDGPMRMPASISPSTAGTPMRSASSATSFAAQRMSASSRRMRPMSRPPAPPAANTVENITTTSQAGRVPRRWILFATSSHGAER